MSAVELKEYSNVIGGKSVSAHNGRSLDMIDPCNGRHLQRYRIAMRRILMPP